MNRVCLVGRLTKDPELKYSQNGTAICNFTLAVDRPYKNSQGEKETDFLSCIVFGRIGENCAEYLGKGKRVAIDGRVQTRNYENKDGKKVYVTEIIADNVQFLTPKSKTDEAPADMPMHEVNPDELPF